MAKEMMTFENMAGDRKGAIYRLIFFAQVACLKSSYRANHNINITNQDVEI